ncbi:MAG: DUF4386 domain-containing protein [Anaerolineales bacterium]|nr:DUF4386 domain-containing protein [Anaerolineales bacterium]
MIGKDSLQPTEKPTTISNASNKNGGESRMNTYRRTAITVGVLFIIGTVAGVLSAVVSGSILNAPDYLIKLSANENQVTIGALLVLIMGFALAMIPAVLFPILRKQNEALALGSVVFRGALEAVTYIAIVVISLLLVKLSQAYVQAGAPDASHFQTLGTLLQEANHWVVQILDIVFSLGALMIYYLFYQSKLIPRWLSGWGFVGAILYLAVPLLGLLGAELGILQAPLALQEMVLAVWLIVKGFDSSAITSLSAKTSVN